jgi:hypothetical protein
MALPPWLNVSPQMFLQAAQAGGAQGLQVAQMRQQSAQQEAAREAAAQEMSMRLAMSREAQMMDQLARQQAGSREDRNLDIRERLGMAELAMREAETAQRRQERQQENVPLELRVLNDPTTGKPVGYGYGRTAKWLTEEIPTEGTPMMDPSGAVVANRFGSRVIPIPRERSYSQAELDAMMMAGKNPFADSEGSAAVVAPPLAPRQQAQEAIPLPASERDLVTGRTYITRRGPAVWNGSKFVQ